MGSSVLTLHCKCNLMSVPSSSCISSPSSSPNPIPGRKKFPEHSKSHKSHDRHFLIVKYVIGGGIHILRNPYTLENLKRPWYDNSDGVHTKEPQERKPNISLSESNCSSLLQRDFYYFYRVSSKLYSITFLIEEKTA